MLQNQKQQGLLIEDQALGMMGFFSTNPNSNSLAPFLAQHDHTHQQFDSNNSHGHQESFKYSFAAAASMLPSLIRGDADVDDDDDDDHDTSTLEHHHHHHHHHGASSNNSSSGLCEALLMSCANNNPKSRDLVHQDQDPSSFMGVPTHHILSLHQTSNPWEWGSSGRESSSMGSKRLFDGDTESVDEDYNDNINNTNNTNNNMNMNKMKNNILGVSGLRMKKTKVARRKVREPRFSFKTLSDVDVLDDGYKWRKYGQKVVKNTQHPRSYYRCTQEKCRVKKRVERLAEDPRMVITTYEGRHAHSPSHDNLNDDSAAATHPLLANFFC